MSIKLNNKKSLECDKMGNTDTPLPLVSIIMPAYNCEKYIAESINSVLMQSYKNYELIIIDDGSKDKTVEIIKNFSLRDSRLKICINKKNQGVSYSRNKGIEIAVGEWIAFLDSDDLWKETKLEEQILLALEKNVSFLFTGSSFINETGQPYSGIFEVPTEISYNQLLKQNVISCSSVMIKKFHLEKYKMERDDTHEDFGLWLRILKNGTKAYGINEPLLIYRISSKSKSSNKIKSVKMTYKTYRYVGLNFFTSTYYLFWYIVKSYIKYKNIKIRSWGN